MNRMCFSLYQMHHYRLSLSLSLSLSLFLHFILDAALALGCQDSWFVCCLALSACLPPFAGTEWHREGKARLGRKLATPMQKSPQPNPTIASHRIAIAPDRTRHEKRKSVLFAMNICSLEF